MAANKKAPSAKQKANWARFARMARERAKAMKGGSSKSTRKVSHMAKTERAAPRKRRGINLMNPDHAARAVGALGTTAALTYPIVASVMSGNPEGTGTWAWPGFVGGLGPRAYVGLQAAGKPSHLAKSFLPSVTAEAVIGGKRLLKRTIGRAASG